MVGVEGGERDAQGKEGEVSGESEGYQTKRRERNDEIGYNEVMLIGY